MNRDSRRTIRWATGEQFADPVRKAIHKSGIDLGTALRLTLLATCPYLSVLQALGLGPLERCFFDQQSLTLVPLAGATPFQDDGSQCRVLGAATRQRGISRWQKHEVVEIRARQAECATIAREKNPCSGAKVFAALVTT
jgi:hypothetical protein